MTDLGKRWYGPAAPGTSTATLFTVSVGAAHVTNITITNVTAIDAVITAMSIGADATGTRILAGTNVPANSVLVINGYWYLANGEIMAGHQGTAAALNVTISGVNET